MLTQATIENLDQTSLPLLSDEDVVQPAVIKHLEELAGDAVFEKEPGEANDLLEALNELITAHENAIKTKSDVYERYTKMLWNLRWKALLSMKPNEQGELLSNNLLFSLKQGFAVHEWLQRMFKVFEYGTYPAADIRRRLLEALGKNSEQLGTNYIQLGKSERVKPTVRNWIQDYDDTLQTTRDTGQYTNTSKNVKQLSNEDRHVLEQLLKIFTDIKYPQLAGTFISRKEAEKEIKEAQQQAAAGTRPLRQPAPATTQENPQVPTQESNAEVIRHIAQQHNLRVDESAAVHDAIMQVFDGAIHPNNFADTLRKELPTLSEEKLRALVTDIDTKIFKPAREAIIQPQKDVGPAQQDTATAGVKKRLTESVYTEPEETNVEERDDSQTKRPYTSQDPYREPIE